MDTIAAIATGNAPAAIGIIRISGPEADTAAARVFQADSGRAFDMLEPRKMMLGTLCDREGRVLDHGLAVRFPAHGSYTGEPSVEFHCHGSPVAMGEILSALFAAGARQAKAGEFTRRAFLNGKLDLTQAEAVIDLIDAETAAAARNAAAQLDGALGRSISAVYDDLTDLTSRFYAVVDYPDEDIEDLSRAQIQDTLRRADGTLSALLATCERGRVLKQGVRTAILGRPNVGKSSLLNALAGYDRAIVTSTAGTTRDTLEESVVCGGILLRLTDTAGLRETSDPIESLGVGRARDAARMAELCLVVLDGSQPLTDEDRAAMDLAAGAPRSVAVVNKADLPMELELKVVSGRFPLVVRLSAKAGTGLDALEAAVAGLFPTGEAAGEVLTDPRQQDAVSRARDAVRRAAEALDAGLTPDAVLTDAEEAMNALGELTGRTAREDIVSAIFSRFCVGK